jgi:hypothetical protein
MSLSSTVNSIINRSPFIQEALSNDLINVSSLSRYIHPQVEKEMGKKVSIPSIQMTINRLPSSPLLMLDKSLSQFMRQIGDVIVRSDLVDYSFQNSATLSQKHVELLQHIDQRNKFFYSYCTGVYETTVVVSKVLTPIIEAIFKNEEIIISRSDLAAVSIMLPSINLDVYGVYYTILKHLAWQGINVVEVISTSHEISLIVAKGDVDQVFTILMKLKLA